MFLKIRVWDSPPIRNTLIDQQRMYYSCFAKVCGEVLIWIVVSALYELDVEDLHESLRHLKSDRRVVPTELVMLSAIDFLNTVMVLEESFSILMLFAKVWCGLDQEGFKSFLLFQMHSMKMKRLCLIDWGGKLTESLSTHQHEPKKEPKKVSNQPHSRPPSTRWIGATRNGATTEEPAEKRRSTVWLT